MVLSVLPEMLLPWYRQNARRLPWRENRDPYRIWVSEIMLQQTRVDTVIGYFNRFTQALPDVSALADCDEDTLLKLWEGLGYYSRVRNLQKTARILLRDFDGRLPDDPKTLRSLPGIGAYTAGAIASIAFEQPTAAVDGNVLRILSRVLADPCDIAAMSVRKNYADLLSAVYPPEGSRGDFTQSLMELGATVCLPNGQPLCEKCPIRSVCQAHLEDMTASFPVKMPKRAKQERDITVLLICADGKIGLMRRPESGLLAGLWSFAHEEKVLSEEEIRQMLFLRGAGSVEIYPLPERKHVFTHVIWHMHAFAVRASVMPKELFAADRDTLERTALPTAFAKYLPDALLLLKEDQNPNIPKIFSQKT